MRSYRLFFLVFIIIFNEARGQRNCGSYSYYQNLIQTYPELSGRYGFSTKDTSYTNKLLDLNGTITIPVVVHIVYNTGEENLSDQDIQNQMEILNTDFRSLNADINNVPGLFKPFEAGDCEIHFDLKNITRTKTRKKEFLIDFGLNKKGKYDLRPEKQPIKFTRTGGIDGDPASEYLNIWVGNIRPINLAYKELLGFATFPGGPDEYDGVVINYKYFGSLHSDAPFNKGRTVTHEVGHWLNLIHIWGDQRCGNDLVDDTPTQDSANIGSPRFPKVTCNNGPLGDMFMNYMDYVDDNSMYMFTRGQRDRMRNIFVEGGQRSSFIITRDENQKFYFNRQRGDLGKPVISKVTQYNNFAVVSWRPVEHAIGYEVSLKEVKAETWSLLRTKRNQIKLTGLKPDGLYEVKVTARFDSYTSESVPFLFIAYKENFTNESTRVQLVEDF